MKPEILNNDHMMFLDRALETQRTALLTAMADAVAECRTAADQAVELTETGEIGLLRLVEILCAAKVQRGQTGGAVLEGTEVQILADALAQLYNGAATAQTSGIPASDPDNTGEGLGYDPEQAKQLLDEAGWDWNYTLRILYYNNDDTSRNVIEAVVYYLESIGMKVETTFSQEGTTDLFTTRDYDIGFKGTGPMDVYYSEFASTSDTFQNIYGGDTSFDEAINAYLSATDPEDVTAAKQALQTLELEKVYKIPLFTIGYMNYINTNRVAIPEDITDLGCPGHRVDMNYEEWYIK